MDSNSRPSFVRGVRVAGGAWVVGFGRDRVYLAVRDDVDLEWLVEYAYPPRRSALAEFLLRFPTTVTLLMLLGFYQLTATGAVRVGPIAEVLIFPLVAASFLVDPIGAWVARLGLPFSGLIEVGLLVLAALTFDWALRRATQ